MGTALRARFEPALSWVSGIRDNALALALTIYGEAFRAI
jgi:hypothetical protein